MKNLTPRETVAELDKYIVGQHAAKKAVAVSLRNRWRRLQLTGSMRDEVTPKNIIMIGATGVGKTEVARRLAKLTKSPFIKVEASKFTEVGYVGRDVESMIRDLMEISISLVKAEKKSEVAAKATQVVEERLLDLLLPPATPATQGYAMDDTPQPQSETREKFRKMLQDGKLEDREIEIQVDDTPHVEVFSNMGLEEMGMNLQDAMKNFFPNKKRAKKLKIKEARLIVEQQEIAKLVDMDEVRDIAVKRAEQSGIIFLDEIDKVCQRDGAHKGGGDVSREGVQRDLLPIVEGSTVITKYGMVRTDHILFIAAGAFSLAKPSDLLPELQGRFPIRVELDSLTKDDFIRILKEPENSLTKQYTALMEQDEVFLKFTDDGIEAIAEMAFEMNQLVENIGARRLHTLLERVLEEVSFDAPECARGEISIDSAYVHAHLDKVVQDKQTRSYIL
ncbi:MAG: ATP-dependent protease ATPase subunit HslU [Deferribacteraceae bacterium]|jgi:ATP-dependent HslUV protease ATP-binding subunit HslU|nr:ATP-dependent protease ATPase subunit HslU [Deferribacteraceae bacterium]